MSDADTILKMIETADPNDTAKLDEIDLAVCEFVHGVAAGFRQRTHHEIDPANSFPKYGITAIKSRAYSKDRYTRSRDALKAIRPEGLSFQMYQNVRPGWFECDLMRFGKITWSTKKKRLPTEELAELYAIIQAIEYERTK